MAGCSPRTRWLRAKGLAGNILGVLPQACSCTPNPVYCKTTEPQSCSLSVGPLGTSARAKAHPDHPHPALHCAALPVTGTVGTLGQGLWCWYTREGGHGGELGEDSSARRSRASAGERGRGGQPVSAAELGWGQSRQQGTLRQVCLGGDEEAGGLPVHVVLLWGGHKRG